MSVSKLQSTVGIIGGMGPSATVDFYAKIIEETQAESDQEHLRVVIWADPRTPDRSAALLSCGTDPTPWIISAARKVESMGATFIAVPCNTAHAFLGRVKKAIGIPIVDMIEETVSVIADVDIRKVGLLATTGTIRSGIYQDRLQAAGVEVLTLGPSEQDEFVMTAIRRIKMGEFHESRELLISAGRSLIEVGACAVIAGCTEIPLVLKTEDLGWPVIDPTRILAKAAVNRAMRTGIIPADELTV